MIREPRQGTLLPQGTTAVQVAPGETVQVSLAEGSTGIGDDWGVVAISDDAVVGADVAIGSAVFGQPPPTDDGGASGGTSAFAVELEGLAPGEATVRVLYCTRTKVAEGCDQTQGTLDAPVDPVEITVTVT